MINLRNIAEKKWKIKSNSAINSPIRFMDAMNNLISIFSQAPVREKSCSSNQIPINCFNSIIQVSPASQTGHIFLVTNQCQSRKIWRQWRSKALITSIQRSKLVTSKHSLLLFIPHNLCTVYKPPCTIHYRDWSNEKHQENIKEVRKKMTMPLSHKWITRIFSWEVADDHLESTVFP